MNLKENRAWQRVTEVVKMFHVLWLSIPFLGVYPKGIIMETHKSPRQGKVCHREKIGTTPCAQDRSVKYITAQILYSEMLFRHFKLCCKEYYWEYM